MHLPRRVKIQTNLTSQRFGPLFLATLGGVASGLGTVALVRALELAEQVFSDGMAENIPLGRWSLVPVVALGGLLAGVVTRSLGSESRGHGVPDVIHAYEHTAGRMPWRVSLSGALATVTTIGSGGSGGQEGPSVHVGSGIASLVGSALRVGQENRRLLVAVGAAGGISAVFNAPLTGGFFALEVVLRRFTVRNFSSVILGSVLANVVYRAVLGPETGLRSPDYGFDSGWQIGTYVALGVATAVVAVLFVRGLSVVHASAIRLNIGVLAPAIGGALVGVIGVWHSQVLGTGTPEIASFLTGEQSARLLILLVGLKIVATSLTIGSGGTGGVFMPSLFLGAAMGGAFGATVNQFVPGMSGPTGAYAVAGMAGVFAGAASAPITALLLAFEVTQDYVLVLPLMTVVVISTAVAQTMMRGTIYSEALSHIGIDVTKEQGIVDRLESISVARAFRPSALAIPSRMEIAIVPNIFATSGHDTLPVLEGGRVAGMLSSGDVLSFTNSESPGAGTLVADVMTRPAITVRPTESLKTAVIRMDEAGVRTLPVVNDAGGLQGMLDRAQILRAYAEVAAGRALPPQPDSPQFDQPRGRFIRARVHPGGSLAGHSLKDLHFPEGSLVVSVRRDGRTLVPRSSTVLQPADQLVVLADDDAKLELQRRKLIPATEPAGRMDTFARAYRRLQMWCLRR